VRIHGEKVTPRVPPGALPHANELFLFRARFDAFTPWADRRFLAVGFRPAGRVAAVCARPCYDASPIGHSPLNILPFVSCASTFSVLAPFGV
jgi:hypothetical protein